MKNHGGTWYARKRKEKSISKARYASKTLRTTVAMIAVLVIFGDLAACMAQGGLDIKLVSVDVHGPSAPMTYPNESIEQKIVRYANEYGVDPERAKTIAWCESRYDAKAMNWQGSTASGVFMWTEPTWKYIGSPGDRFNADDNIKAFMEYWPTHKGWWVCTKLTE